MTSKSFCLYIIFLWVGVLMGRYVDLLIQAEKSSIESPLGEATANLKDIRTVTPRHVLFGLSGNDPGFMNEFEVAFKSVLLNGPIDDPLTIHIMANQDAYNAIGKIFKKANLSKWQTRDPVTIKTYNIQSLEADWLVKINNRMAPAANFTTDSLFRHTVGTYYRLFANDVLPKTVDAVVYLDTDAIVISSLDDIFNHHLQDDMLWQWGEYKCAGFLVLRPQKIERIWQLWSQVPIKLLAEMMKGWAKADDQLVLRAVERIAPDEIGSLPTHWDVSAMDGPWKFKPQKVNTLPQGASVLHYNGGGASKEAFFKDHKHYETNEQWGLSRYYVNMPWTWAQQQLKGRVRKGQEGYPLTLDYVPQRTFESQQ